MLANYPTYFNTTEILNPTEWEMDSKKIQNTATTEGGKDSVTQIRKQKLEITATYYVTDKWVKIFEEFSWEQQFTLKRYDVFYETYDEATVRMEDFKYKLLKGSEKITVSNGLYEVSFRLVEF